MNEERLNDLLGALASMYGLEPEKLPVFARVTTRLDALLKAQDLPKPVLHDIFDTIYDGVSVRIKTMPGEHDWAAPAGELEAQLATMVKEHQAAQSMLGQIPGLGDDQKEHPQESGR